MIQQHGTSYCKVFLLCFHLLGRQFSTLLAMAHDTEHMEEICLIKLSRQQFNESLFIKPKAIYIKKKIVFHSEE